MDLANFVIERWEYFFLAFYTLEKIIKLSPSKKDDVLFDSFLRPIWDSVAQLLKVKR